MNVCVARAISVAEVRATEPSVSKTLGGDFEKFVENLPARSERASSPDKWAMMGTRKWNQLKTIIFLYFSVFKTSYLRVNYNPKYVPFQREANRPITNISENQNTMTVP